MWLCVSWTFNNFTLSSLNLLTTLCRWQPLPRHRLQELQDCIVLDVTRTPARKWKTPTDRRPSVRVLTKKTQSRGARRDSTADLDHRRRDAPREENGVLSVKMGHRKLKSPRMRLLLLVSTHAIDQLANAQPDPSNTAAAAARINAQLQARKGIQHVDVPPIKSSSPGDANPSSDSKSHSVSDEMYQADGDYIQDIEVNDLRNRYLLTKGATQKMVSKECSESRVPFCPRNYK